MNFAMVMDPGTLCVLPSGFVYIIYRVADTFALQWSFFPNIPGEAARLQKSIAMTLECYPSLRSTSYAQLLAHLESPSS